MLTFVIAVVVVCGIVYWVRKTDDASFRKPIKKIETAVNTIADVNNDGKVDIKDAVEAVKTVKKAAKITTQKVKKTVGRKKKN